MLTTAITFVGIIAALVAAGAAAYAAVLIGRLTRNLERGGVRHSVAKAAITPPVTCQHFGEDAKP